jgi:tripartite-type tricarboxylate transporter receptor subunit TctC
MCQTLPRSVFTAFLLVTFFASPARVLAALDNFYEGKTIRIIVGQPPGGGVDLRARIFARHLPKWIPGSPRIIVQNLPGAGGLIAANYAFAAPKPDGLTFVQFAASTVMHSFLAPDRVKYDIRKLHILRTSGDIWLTVVNPKTTGVRTAKDLQRATVRIAIGATSPTSPRSLRPKLAMELLGVDHNWVTGYAGSAPLVAAHDRDEIHLYEDSLTGFAPILEPREKEGRMALLWQTGFVDSAGTLRRSPLVADLPTLEELLPQERKRGTAWEAYKALVVPLTIQQTAALPAGVPADRVQILTRAFVSMAEDPAFRQEYEKALGVAGDIFVGPKADQAMKSAVKQLEELRDGVRYLRDFPQK